MELFKIVDKAMRSFLTFDDYYSIKYQIGEIVTAPLHTLGIFLFRDYKIAKQYAVDFTGTVGYHILLIKPLGTIIVPEIISKLGSYNLKRFYIGDNLDTSMLIQLDEKFRSEIACCHSIRVLKDITNDKEYLK